MVITTFLSQNSEAENNKFLIFLFSAILHGLLLLFVFIDKNEQLQQLNLISVSIVSEAAPSSEVNVENKNISTDGKSDNSNIAKKESYTNGKGSDISNVVSQAKYRFQVPPIYPKRALEQEQQGTVILHVFLKEDGSFEELKIATSSGHYLLDEAALKAVKKWQFEPIIKNGKVISGWVEVPVQFIIKT